MLIFALAVFLSAFLLFQVQPIAGKHMLPWFGGTPGVWTTCLLFFQALLLAGYAYAHAISRLSVRRQAWLHCSVVGISLILLLSGMARWPSPITPGTEWRPENPSSPAAAVLGLLTLSVGLPYFVLSTTGPLVQSWFVRTEQRSPYRLYALSNAGSLLALVSYPVLVEPLLRLRTQGRTWTLLYAAFAVLLIFCARKLARTGQAEPVVDQIGEDTGSTAKPTLGRYSLWMALAATTSILLLATTNQLTQDVAPVPFLWVLPLAIYLLSFILTFDSDRWYRRGWAFPLLGASYLSVLFLLFRTEYGIRVQLPIYAVLLFALCMVCHGELVRLRPAPRYLTAFYLMISLGGALGGLFVALIAPRIFSSYWEFHAGLVISGLLIVAALWLDRTSWLHTKPFAPAALCGFIVLVPAVSILRRPDSITVRYAMLEVGIAVLILWRHWKNGRRHASTRIPVLLGIAAVFALGSVLAVNMAGRSVNAVLTKRNFYGSLAVVEYSRDDSKWHRFTLRHGQILHGSQFTAADKRDFPTTYYGPRSGADLAINHHPERGKRGLRVGVIGLGIGTIAAYGQKGDLVRFYEINPDVIKVAIDNNGRFSYLHRTPAEVEIVPGDARLSMERELRKGQAQQYDVLVLDAFSGDTIPLHLISAEAFEVYARHMAPGGIIAAHISNRHLDLRPVLWRLAQEYGYTPALVRGIARENVTQASDWVVFTREPNWLQSERVLTYITWPTSTKPVPLWTDDYSNLFAVLK
ncbi:MAG TPA: ferrichrome ABC transporter permease [Candidatus Nanoarchaeia archaeon]|nr:ferrichrome ABC transporter permease [Candidatus Nanoarchaeia archaeon]